MIVVWTESDDNDSGHWGRYRRVILELFRSRKET